MTAFPPSPQGEVRSCPTAPKTSATWPWQATPPPAKPHSSKPCCTPAARSRRQAPSNAAAPCPTSIRSRSNAAIRSTPRSPASTTAARPASIHVNLIDTPGYPDFRGPALSALAAVETVAIVVDADSGVGIRHAPDDGARQGAQPVPRASSSTRSTTPTPTALACSNELRETFGPECLPLNLPADGGKQVIDCFGNTDGDSDLGPVADWHQKIIDQVVEINENGDGALPRPRRGRPVGRGTARRVRAMPARGPPGAGAVLLGAQRRRHQGTARRRRKPVPESHRSQPACLPEGQRHRRPQPIEAAPDPKRTSSPTCSRSSTIPSSASSACSASTRAR